MPAEISMHATESGPCGDPTDTVGDSLGGSFLGFGPCETMLLGWAVGGSAFRLPNGTAFTLNAADARYIVIEVHYDNPSRASNLTDDSGVKLYLTSGVSPSRPNEVGTLSVGDVSLSLPSIPAGLSSLHYETMCPTECTQQFSGPLNVIGSFLHMHAIGRQIYTTKTAASDQSIMTTNRIDYWSFSFQQVTPVNFTIQPGDRINVHGVFDSTRRTRPTTFGLASTDEMLFDFMFFWPKSNAGSIHRCGYFRGKSICGSDVLDSIPNPGKFEMTM
jgi:hypothetical protein